MQTSREKLMNRAAKEEHQADFSCVKRAPSLRPKVSTALRQMARNGQVCASKNTTNVSELIETDRLPPTSLSGRKTPPKSSASIKADNGAKPVHQKASKQKKPKTGGSKVRYQDSTFWIGNGRLNQHRDVVVRGRGGYVNHINGFLQEAIDVRYRHYYRQDSDGRKALLEEIYRWVVLDRQGRFLDETGSLATRNAALKKIRRMITGKGLASTLSLSLFASDQATVPMSL